MSTFKIEWEDELYEYNTPLEAAKAAFEEIKDGSALAFTVTELSTGRRYSIDLNEEEGYEVLKIEN